jgi:hypothetical protein
MIVGHEGTTFTETFAADGFDMPLEVTPTGVGSLLVAESGASRVALFDLAARTITTRFDVGAVRVAAWASGGSNYFVLSKKACRFGISERVNNFETADLFV